VNSLARLRVSGFSVLPLVQIDRQAYRRRAGG
jgi:hypothetical protein